MTKVDFLVNPGEYCNILDGYKAEEISTESFEVDNTLYIAKMLFLENRLQTHKTMFIIGSQGLVNHFHVGDIALNYFTIKCIHPYQGIKICKK